MSSKKKGTNVKKVEDISKVIEQNKDYTNSADKFWNDNKELIPIYISNNRYNFYIDPKKDIIYKVCQESMYLDKNTFEMKKTELEKQINEINEKHDGLNLIPIIKYHISDDLVWFSSKKVKNIRSVFSNKNSTIFLWKEIKPFAIEFANKFVKKYVKKAKNLYEEVPYNPSIDSVRWKEYIDYLNQLCHHFGIVFSNTIPEKIQKKMDTKKGFFPEKRYNIMSSLTTENIFLNDKLKMTILDPKFKEESLEYYLANFIIMAENFDNDIFGNYHRWKKFSKNILGPEIMESKQIKNIDEDLLNFYVGIRYIEIASEFLLRSHDVSIKALKKGLLKFSEIELFMIKDGVLSNKSTKKNK